jgi:hypothetical protein
MATVHQRLYQVRRLPLRQRFSARHLNEFNAHFMHLPHNRVNGLMLSARECELRITPGAP